MPASKSFGAKLINALENDNFQLFHKILNEQRDNDSLNVDIAEYNCSTPLYMAVKSGKLIFIKELLKNSGVDINRPHSRLKKYPIHLASEMECPDIVFYLVQAGANTNAKTENGTTALHIAVAHSDKDLKREENVLQVIRILLSSPKTSVDCENNIGITPLEFAIEKGSEAAVELLLHAAASVSKIRNDGGTLEELLAVRMPTLYERFNLSINRRSPGRCVEEKLFDILYAFHNGESSEKIHNQATDLFIQEWQDSEQNNNKGVNGNYDNGSYTFLQYVCDLGMDVLVKFLLEQGVDPNLCSQHYKYPPLIIAAHHGYYKIIKILKNNSMVAFGVRDGVRHDTALHVLVKAESRAYMNYEHRDYDQCLSIILDDNSLKSKLNIIQPMIDAQDNRGNTALHLAGRLGNENAILKILRAGANIGVKNSKGDTAIEKISTTILHSYLDECIHGEGTLIDEDFKLVFNYNFLGPPLRQMKEVETISDNEAFMSPCPKFDYDYLPEAEPLWYISQSRQHKNLLCHPVISSFLCLKWRRIRPYYWLYVIFHLIFLLTLTFYLLFDSLSGVNNPTLKIGLERKILATLVAFFVILLVGKEIFKAVVSFRRYIFSISNYFKVLLISILISIFLIKQQSKLDLTATNKIPCLSGIAILLSWLEMAFLLGRHPKVSTYIIMFKTVSQNFFIFLFIFQIFIVAFALSFFFVLPPENEYFSTPYKSLLKTVVMSLTGEIEFEEIKFGVNNAELLAVSIFLLFIFFILLVLVNLLNGLAVSDISIIQKRSEIVALIARVDLISYIESVLLGDPFKFLTNWPSVKSLRKLPPCDCLSKMYTLKCVRRAFSRIMGNILLFRSLLPSKRAVFCPNKSSFEIEESLINSPKPTLILDKSIILVALSLVGRNETKELTELKSLEKSVNLVVEQQQKLMHYYSRMSGE